MKEDQNKLSDRILKFLSYFCPTQFLEEIEGDLLHRFEKDVRLHGKRKANRKFLWNTLMFFRPGILFRNKFVLPSNPLPIFGNYFKTTFRHIGKSRTNFAFKMAGLSLALFTLLVIVMYVSYQLSFDKQHQDYKNIYRVNASWSQNGNLDEYATVPFELGPSLKSESPEIKSFTRFSLWGDALMNYNGKLIRAVEVFETDSSVFNVFSFNIISGSKNPLNEPNSIVLTRKLARQIFGDEEPLHKILTFPDRFNRTLEVTAIIKDLPSNSHLSMQALMRFGALREDRTLSSYPWEISWNASTNLYLRVNEHANPHSISEKAAPLFRSNLAKAEDGREKTFSIFLQPIADIYLAPPLKMEFCKKGNSIYVYAFSVLGIFLLVIASINYLNLSIADFSNRSKEIGVRKVLGARRNQITTQLIFETVMFCIVSLLISVALLYLLLPFVINTLDANLNFEMLTETNILIAAACVLLLLVSISTTYPAYRLAMSNPVKDFKKLSSSGNMSISKVLLFMQFLISAICMTCTWIVGEQVDFFRKTDIGFERRNLISLVMPDRYPEEKAYVLKDEVSKLASVDAVSFSYYHMTGVSYFRDWYQIETGNEMKKIMLNEVFVDHNFFRTMNVGILKGRSFNLQNPADVHSAFIVNETAVREFGWDEPIGKRIIYGFGESEGERWDGTVVGVAKDFNTRPLHEKIKPLVMRLQYDSWPGRCLNVRIKGDFKKSLAEIESAFNKVLPGYLMDYRIVDDMYEKQYASEDRIFTALRAGTWIILLISSMGIFSLSIYMSAKRMKEFGIRKVLGATAAQITSMQIGYFVKIVLLANVVALPVSYGMMKGWLNGFAYKTEISSLFFFNALIISIMIVIVSASHAALKSARMNPVDVIKSE